MSRVVGGAHLLDTREKEVFRKQMHGLAEFCGVEVLTYAVMSNHFHILVRVPDPETLEDDELLRRYRLLYQREPKRVREMEELFAAGKPDVIELERQRLKDRMGDVSLFIKELKQRFAIWYNRNHKRYGAFWAERFKSVLVEENDVSLPTVSAYIDLNAVRAGLAEDPKDYRFCGFAEMCAGHARMTQGLRHILDTSDLEWALSEYRKILYLYGSAPAKEEQASLDKSRVMEVIESDGKVSLAEVLRLRVRYFTDGAVLGSREFVETYFRQHREQFGEKRKSGARKMRGFDQLGLAVLRDLRRSVFS